VRLCVALTSQLEIAVCEDSMTSHVSWLDIITRCKQSQQELEAEQHRCVTDSVESLTAAVCSVFRHQQATEVRNSSDDDIDNEDTTKDAAAQHDAVVTDDGKRDEEYSQILD